MARIAFIITPILSHLNATNLLAQMLRQRGHDIFYISENEELKAVVELSGFEFRSVTTKAFDRLPEFNKRNKFNGWHAFIHRLKIQRQVNKIYLTTNILHDTIANVKPDLIFLDCQYIHYTVFLTQYRMITFSTSFSLDKQPNIPPLGSPIKIKDTLISHLRVEIVWQWYFLTNFLVDQKVKARYLWMYLGITDLSLMRVLAKRVNFPFDKYIDRNREMFFRFKHIPEITLVPKCLELPHAKCRDYVGTSNTLLRKEPDASLEIQEVFKTIKDKRKNGLKVIYCSLGTLSLEVFPKADILFEKIIKAAATLPDCLTIVSTGMIDPVRFNEHVSERVYIYQRLPQLEVLSFTDVLVFHGGLQSLTESILNKVPVVCFPFTRLTDVYGNALRIVHHELGLQGKICDEVQNIADKISFVLVNHGRFLEKISIMRESLLTEKIGLQLVEKIERFIQTSTWSDNEFEYKVN
ncbi:MAG: hypothetical protein DI539_09400 [Flavobacterium psychrophilum]|jgi:UDP:flavonoid glycosyltransferase YjiC (YdhE family)|nr:MAG: hypothetical protein DI539_09400 [Flavobacterium psychrophilum]